MCCLLFSGSDILQCYKNILGFCICDIYLKKKRFQTSACKRCCAMQQDPVVIYNFKCATKEINTQIVQCSQGSTQRKGGVVERRDASASVHACVVLKEFSWSLGISQPEGRSSAAARTLVLFCRRQRQSEQDGGWLLVLKSHR